MLVMALTAFAAIPTSLTLGSATGPPGVMAEWTVDGCYLRLRLANATPAPIELDWMRSVYAPKGDAAVAVMPGSSSKMSAMIAIPPMVVPPDSFAEELVFRKDRLPSDGGEGCIAEVGTEATITLSISGQWLVQPMTFKVDVDASLAIAEAAKRAAEQEALRRSEAAAIAAKALKTEALKYSDLDVRVGELCLDGPGVSEKCLRGAGAGWEKNLDVIATRMELLGCPEADVDEMKRHVRTWKGARIAGNSLVWIYGAGALIYLHAGGEATAAERAYGRCMTRAAVEGTE